MNKINFKIQEFESLDSSNDYLKRLIQNDSPQEGTVIITKHQTSGKGRGKRRWESPKGNIYMSVLLKPNIDIQETYPLPLVIAVVIGKSICKFLDESCKVEYKWPNDILINGKKCAGILIENEIQDFIVNNTVIGIGINTSNAPIIPDYETTCLLNEDDEFVTDEKLIQEIIINFNDLYNKWLEHGFSAIRNEWLSNAANLNKQISINVDKVLYTGIFEDINDKGEIALRLNNGKIRFISCGEIL